MSEARFILGIDLGGTHVKGLVVDEWGRVYAEDTRPTEDGAAGAWRDNVRRVVAGLQGDAGHGLKQHQQHLVGHQHLELFQQMDLLH